MRPTITRTELYSYLVTRHTGRTVRTSILRRIEDVDGEVLTVLDLRHVPLIDFSCADEVVAKLVTHARSTAPPRRFVLFQGVAEHHLEPIESALGRQGLSAAAQDADGEPFLIGSVKPEAARAWREICALGHAVRSVLAERLDLSGETLADALDALEDQRLVVRDGDAYLSFVRVLSEAGAQE